MDKAKTLHLTLKKRWWDMIERGEKTEEYREIKDYWTKRFIDIKAVQHEQQTRNGMYRLFGGFIPAQVTYSDGLKYFPKYHYDVVCFHYGRTARTMSFEIQRIIVGIGKPEWGAPDNKKVFIIILGRRIA